jgi:hypothetical protein
LRQRVKKVSQVKEKLNLDGADTSDNFLCGFHANPYHLVGKKPSTKSLTKKDSTKKDLTKPRQNKFQKRDHGHRPDFTFGKLRTYY